jgi:hypothetical protein
MKYIAIDECIMFGKVGPFDKARMDTTNNEGNLYAQCNECKIHHCRIQVKEEK